MTNLVAHKANNSTDPHPDRSRRDRDQLSFNHHSLSAVATRKSPEQKIKPKIFNNNMSAKTIHPHPNFNVREDCEIIRQAIKGAGTNEEAIVAVLARRSCAQRVEIRETYQRLYQKDLLNEIKSELGGDLRYSVSLLLMEPTERDAYIVRKAVEGMGTDEEALSDIICTRSPSELQDIRETYYRMYKKEIEKDIQGDTSGRYKEMLMACLSHRRDELTPDMIRRVEKEGITSAVDIDLAKAEALELFHAGEKKFSACEPNLVRILAQRQKYQLHATFHIYEQLAGKDLFTRIDNEISNKDLGQALKDLTLSTMSTDTYYSNSIYEAIKGKARDKVISRILISRSEIDLNNIKAEFQKQCQCSMSDAILSKTSGVNQKLYYCLLSGNL